MSPSPDDESRGAGDWQLLRRDQEMQGKTLSELVSHQRAMAEDISQIKGDLRQNKAVASMEEEHLEERLARIEASVQRVYRLGLYILGAFLTSAMSLLTLIVKAVFFP